MKISVCIASYNGEKYIAQQIESILNCLKSNDELIISDDGSSDNTLAIVASCKDERIMLVKNTKQSVVENFKNAVSYASGELIVLSDQDDVWFEDRISSILNHHIKYGVVVCNAEFCDDKLSPKGFSIFDVYKPTTSIIKVFTANIFIGCSMSFTRKYKQSFLAMPSRVPMHDWLLGLMALVRRDVYFEERSLFLFRRHDVNSSTTGNTSNQTIIKKLKDRLFLLYGLLIAEVVSMAKGYSK